MQVYQELRLKKKFRYIIFKINDSNTLVQMESAVEKADYAEFVNALPKDGCRFAVFDLQYETEGGTRNKIIFFTW